MMPATDLDPALEERLERLTGDDAACCVDDLQAAADAARQDPGFQATLQRAKALSHEGRLLAAALLKRRGELCACEVQAALGLSHATVSHHMQRLTDAGVAEVERRGKWAYYRLNPDAAHEIP